MTFVRSRSPCLDTVIGLVGELEAEGDDGHQAAGGGALFAVGEEEVGAAGGAEVDGVDVLGTEAGG